MACAVILLLIVVGYFAFTSKEETDIENAKQKNAYRNQLDVKENEARQIINGFNQRIVKSIYSEQVDCRFLNRICRDEIRSAQIVIDDMKTINGGCETVKQSL